MTQTPLSVSEGQRSTRREHGYIVAASHTACEITNTQIVLSVLKSGQSNEMVPSASENRTSQWRQA